MANNIVEYVLKIQSKNAQKSLMEVSKAAKTVDKNFISLDKELKKTGASAKKSGSDILSFGKKGLAIAGPLGSAITGVKSAFNMMAGSIGTAAEFLEEYTQQVFQFVRQAVDAVNRLNDMSTASGLAAETIQAVQLAFEASGQSASTADTILKKFPQRMADIRKQGSDSNEIIKAMGIAIRDTSGNFRDSDSVFKEIIHNLQNLEDQELRTAAAQKIFKRDVGNLLVALGNTGPLERFIEFTTKFGVDAKKSADNAATFQQRMAALSLSFAFARDRIVDAFGGMQKFNVVLREAVGVVVFSAEMVRLFSGEIKFVGGVIFNFLKAALNPMIMGLSLLGNIAPKAAEDFGRLLVELGAFKAGEAPFTNISLRIAEAKKAADEAKNSLSLFNKQIDEGSAKTSASAKKYQKLKKTIDGLFEGKDGAKKQKSNMDQLAKAQERAKSKLAELIAVFKDGDRNIQSTARALRKLTREFIKLKLPTKDIDAFAKELRQIITNQELQKIDNFVQTMKELDDISMTINIDTTRALAEISQLMKKAAIIGTLDLTSQIVNAVSGDAGAIQGIITKLFGGIGGSVAGVGGALAGFGGRMKEVGNLAIEQERERRIEEAIARAERSGTLTKKRRAEIEQAAGFLTAEEQKEIIHQARVQDARQRVKDFTDSIAIAIEMLPEILINVLPPAIVNGTINIIKTLLGLPAEIGRQIAKFLKGGFEEFAEKGGKAISVAADVVKEIFTFGLAETETFNKRSGGRIPSAAGGMKFTGAQKSGLALLHENEFVVPASGQRPQSVDRVMNNNSQAINININGMLIESNAVDMIVRKIEQRFQTFGTSQSTLFGS